MKHLRSFLLVIFLIFSSAAANAQTIALPQESDFSGAFAITYGNDAYRHYYAVNLNNFPEAAMQVHFQNSIFGNAAIVPASVPQNGLWYFNASSDYTTAWVLTKLEEYRSASVLSISQMSQSQKDQYVIDNQKY